APLFFKLIELVRQQDSAPGRRYPHIEIAVLQKLFCLLDGRPRRRTAEIDPAKLIVAADQVLQFGRPIHAGMPRPTSTKKLRDDRRRDDPAGQTKLRQRKLR